MKPLLVIACGAIGRELVRIRRASGWQHMDLKCLPPQLHNRPERITGAVEHAFQDAGNRYQRLFVAAMGFPVRETDTSCGDPH